jgi:hypothetical protein
LARPDLITGFLNLLKIKKMEILHKLSLIILFISVVSLSYSISYSQSEVNEKPCTGPEYSQLDFWIGNWQAEWIDNEGKIQTGSNIITKTLGGCVIEENFSTSDNTFTGRSFSVYNPVKKIWQQTWVDNSGGYLDFNGGMDGDKMILTRKGFNRKGEEIMQRMVFMDISSGSFTWNWESSTNNGAEWNLMWQIKYKRKP